MRYGFMLAFIASLALLACSKANATTIADLIAERPDACVYRIEGTTFEVRRFNQRACPLRLRVFTA